MPRGDIFLTTKLDNPDHARAADALRDSLRNLDTSYIDLCTYGRCVVITKFPGVISIARAHALACSDDEELTRP